MEDVYYYVFETPMGWVGIAGTEGTITKMELPKATRSEAEAAIKEGLPDSAVESKHDFSGEVERIRAYFAGERVDFQCKLEPAGGEFDQRVWAACRKIGYGEIESYGRIADRIGKQGAARAVGQALGRNPIPVIIPCHRVVRTDGGLGGFGGGLRWKVRLLELERNHR